MSAMAPAIARSSVLATSSPQCRRTRASRSSRPVDGLNVVRTMCRASSLSILKPPRLRPFLMKMKALPSKSSKHGPEDALANGEGHLDAMALDLAVLGHALGGSRGSTGTGPHSLARGQRPADLQRRTKGGADEIGCHSVHMRA